MRTLLITLVALVVGFAIGIKLSEVIGIVGMLGFGHAVGIKYLPTYLATSSAIVVNLLYVSMRRKSKKVDERKEKGKPNE